MHALCSTAQSNSRGNPSPSLAPWLPYSRPPLLCFTLVSMQGTTHAICKHFARHAPAPCPPVILWAPDCTCCQRSITLRLPAAATAPARAAAAGGRSKCRGGRGPSRPRLPPGQGFTVPPAAPGRRGGSIKSSCKRSKKNRHSESIYVYTYIYIYIYISIYIYIYILQSTPLSPTLGGSTIQR